MHVNCIHRYFIDLGILPCKNDSIHIGNEPLMDCICIANIQNKPCNVPTFEGSEWEREVVANCMQLQRAHQLCRVRINVRWHWISARQLLKLHICWHVACIAEVHFVCVCVISGCIFHFSPNFWNAKNKLLMEMQMPEPIFKSMSWELFIAFAKVQISSSRENERRKKRKTMTKNKFYIF